MTFDRSFIGPGALSDLVPALWRQQTQDWPRLAQGIASLRHARRRTFDIDGSQVIAQCNPARAASASARIDEESLAARPCFLCMDNLPKSQCAIIYRKDWLILCNPAPIVEPHFTISSMNHQPQRILDAAEVMFDLSRDLDGVYSLFYNGPRCGASAPDHLHVQAAPAGVFPYEKELVRQLCCGSADNGSRWIDWVQARPVRTGMSRPGRRPAVFLLGRSKDDLMAQLDRVLAVLGEIQPASPEPMVNLFVTYADQCWTVWLFPRRAHRAANYGMGPDEMLLSPGAIDLAGVLIAPRTEDFERLDGDTVRAVYDEVLLAPEAMDRLRDRLAEAVRGGAAAPAHSS